jgi:hypothetical protein
MRTVADLLVGLFPALSGTIREKQGWFLGMFFSFAGVFVKLNNRRRGKIPTATYGRSAALLRLLTICLGVVGTSSQMVIAQIND